MKAKIKEKVRKIVAEVISEYDFHNRTPKELLENCPESIDQTTTQILEEIGELKGSEWDIIHRGGKSFMGVIYYYTNQHRKREYKSFKCKTFKEIIHALHTAQKERIKERTQR